MNADLIKSVLIVVAALIPLLIVIVNIIYDRIKERTTDRIDSSFFKKIIIVRNPVTKYELKSLREDSHFNLKAFIVSLSFFYILLYLTATTNNIFYPIAKHLFGTQNFNFYYLFGIIIIFIFFDIVMYFPLRSIWDLFHIIFKSDEPEDIKYFCFKEINIEIEADYHYLFNKCQDALRSMDVKISDVNEIEGTISSCYVESLLGLVILRLRLINVTVKPKENSYIVEFKIVKYTNITRSSKIINLFVNRLISKSKNGDDKSKPKIDVPDDVGD